VGAATGAVSGAAGGAVQALVSGDDVGQAVKEGAVSGAIGGAAGAVVGQVAQRYLVASKMAPYREAGGHHPVSQAAMRTRSRGPFVPNYNRRQALAISEEVLEEVGVAHEQISANQNRLYRAWRADNPTAPVTWEVVRDIESKAMSKAGMEPGMARVIVDKAIKDLQSRGVAAPGRIPYVDP
jgi:hypothetical protein